MMKMYFGVGTHKILFLDNAFAEFVSRKFSSKSCLFTKKKKIKVENKTVKIRFNRCFLNFCQILKMFPCFHFDWSSEFCFLKWKKTYSLCKNFCCILFQFYWLIGDFLGRFQEVWLDKRTGGVCFSISSKALTITGIDDRRYWNHIPTEESRWEICHNIGFCSKIGIETFF